MTENVSDCIAIMRKALGRSNLNDPDSTDVLFASYISDFMQYTMTDDVKIFEQFGTFTFDIMTTATDHTDGIWTFADVGMIDNFSNLRLETYISLKAPADSSTSWTKLTVIQDPATFWGIWGINNKDVLVRGYPTMMLLYGTQMAFRTIPEDDTAYQVQMYGYTINSGVDQTSVLPMDYWKRYVAYGGAMNYARDYRFEPDALSLLKDAFAHEKKLILTRTHNQIKRSRCLPRF